MSDRCICSNEIVPKNNLHYVWDFFEACKNGNLALVIDFIPMIENLYLIDGLEYACLGGNINVVEFLLPKLNTKTHDKRLLLPEACLSGNASLIEMLINFGFDEFSSEAAYNIGANGDTNLIRFLNINDKDQKYALFIGACNQGKIAMCNYILFFMTIDQTIIQKGANICCKIGQLVCFQFLFPREEIDLKQCFLAACKHNQWVIIDYILYLKKMDIEEMVLSLLLSHLSKKGTYMYNNNRCKKTFNTLISGYGANINNVFITACQKKYVLAIIYIVNHFEIKNIEEGKKLCGDYEPNEIEWLNDELGWELENKNIKEYNFSYLEGWGIESKSCEDYLISKCGTEAWSSWSNFEFEDDALSTQEWWNFKNVKEYMTEWDEKYL